MKNFKKILILSVVLMIVGTLGLFLTLFIDNLGTGLTSFDISLGYNFCP
jgi:hypothetical protein